MMKKIHPMSRLLRHYRDMFSYQRSGLHLGASPFCFQSETTNRENVNHFVRTDDQVELLLRLTNEYKVAKIAENVD